MIKTAENNLQRNEFGYLGISMIKNVHEMVVFKTIKSIRHDFDLKCL